MVEPALYAKITALEHRIALLERKLSVNGIGDFSVPRKYCTESEVKAIVNIMNLNNQLLTKKTADSLYLTKEQADTLYRKATPVSFLFDSLKKE